MDIQFAILGLLSWRPLAGYDLKKMIAESDLFYWSGNNNQIYNSLVSLHRLGFVTQEVQYQESLPAKKVYTITEKGREELRKGLLTTPELPEYRNGFLIQLACAHPISDAEMDALLGQYEAEIAVQLKMKQAANQPAAPNRTPRERYLWEKIAEHMLKVYQNELDWVTEVRKGLRERHIER